MAPQNTPLTQVQDIKIEIASKLFDHYVGDKAKGKEFEQKLRDYTHAHPTLSITDSANLIFDRVLDKPIYRKSDVGDLDARVSMHTQFANELPTAFKDDKRLTAMAKADAIRAGDHLEDVEAASHVPAEMAIAAIALHTSFNNDTAKAIAVSHAVTTLLHADTGGLGAITEMRWPTDSANPAERLKLAKAAVTADLKNSGITNATEADINQILNAAQKIAKNHMPEKSPQR